MFMLVLERKCNNFYRAACNADAV